MHTNNPTRLPSFIDYVLATFNPHDANLDLFTRVLARHIRCGEVNAIHLQSIETLRHHLEARSDLEMNYDELRAAADDLWNEFVSYAEVTHELHLPFAFEVAGSQSVQVSESLAHP